MSLLSTNPKNQLILSNPDIEWGGFNKEREAISFIALIFLKKLLCTHKYFCLSF
jgi:hypothetical protein